MKILYVSPFAELGGSEQSLLDLVAALQQRGGFELGLLSLARGPLVDAAGALGIETRVLELPRELAGLGESAASLMSALSGLPEFLRRAPEVGEFLKRFRGDLFAFEPDLLHTNGIKAHWLAMALAPRTLPVVFHVHDYLSERRISRHLFKFARLRRSTIVANSASVALDARALVTGIPIHTLLNAIDTERFAPGASEPAWLADLAGMSVPVEGEISLVLVATFARWKGQDLAIRALSELRARVPEVRCRLYVVGSPIYETRGSQFSADELRSLAEALGVAENVGFVPFQLDTPRVYRCADVVVHASTRREPFGRTIVEAMACGRPVVVSRAGGARELFVDGETALGFERGNASSLAEALARLLTQSALRARLGAAAREHSLASFSRSRLGPAMEDVYRRAVRIA